MTEVRQSASRARRWLRAASLRGGSIALGTLAAMLLLEVALRFPFLPLSDDLRTHLFQRYTPVDELSSLSYSSPSLEIGLNRPNLDVEAVVSPHRWRHHTDAFGLREPTTLSHADVVVIGDSLVYGQGVEQTETLVARLGASLGVVAANLGRTHTCPVQYLPMLESFGLPLAPRLAVIVYFMNDLDEVAEFRPPAALRRFVANGRAPEAQALPREQIVREDDGARPGHFWRAVEQRALSWRVLTHASWRLRRRLAGQHGSLPRPRREGSAPDDDASLALAYTRRAALRMQDAARERGTRLLFAYLPALSADEPGGDAAPERAVRRLATELAVPYVDLGSVLGEGGRRKSALYLAGDVHLSPEGHRVVGEALAEVVRQRQLLDVAGADEHPAR